MAEYIKLDDAINAIADGAFIFTSSQLNIGVAMLSAFGKIKKADVRENVRGKWISDMTGYKCSVCGLWVDDEAFYYLMEPSFDECSNYCPNCGADMRGSNND